MDGLDGTVISEQPSDKSTAGAVLINEKKEFIKGRMRKGHCFMKFLGTILSLVSTPVSH